MGQATLEIRNLNTSFFTRKGEVRAACDVSLEVRPGQITGIVGESGCGKSVTAKSVLGLVKYPGRVVSGEILLEGREIRSLSKKEQCALRGSDISMIFQEPMTSLNPVMKIGKQVEEALLLHQKITKKQARQKTIEMFGQVGISDAESRMDCYPHQLSGGLRQRVMIAMAMICGPKILIADEPTTALDVTVEAQILRLMKKLCEGGTSILLISHNLGVIAQVCDYVYVMYAGRIVEQADTFTLFDHPVHPYTKGLLNAVSSLRSGARVLDTIPGVVPNLLHLPAGCAFSPRCAQCIQRCREKMPGMFPVVREGHLARCYLAENAQSIIPPAGVEARSGAVSDRTVSLQENERASSGNNSGKEDSV